MKTSPQADISENHPAHAAHFKHSAGALVLAISAVFIVGTVVPYISADSSGDSVVRRCDARALSTVGPSPADAETGRHWRQERKLAFEHCVDASLLAQPQHATP
jgi:hypothetical protein